jgi:hypothetical protein
MDTRAAMGTGADDNAGTCSCKNIYTMGIAAATLVGKSAKFFFFVFLSFGHIIVIIAIFIDGWRWLLQSVCQT